MAFNIIAHIFTSQSALSEYVSKSQHGRSSTDQDYFASLQAPCRSSINHLFVPHNPRRRNATRYLDCSKLPCILISSSLLRSSVPSSVMPRDPTLHHPVLPSPIWMHALLSPVTHCYCCCSKHILTYMYHTPLSPLFYPLPFLSRQESPSIRVRILVR